MIKLVEPGIIVQAVQVQTSRPESKAINRVVRLVGKFISRNCVHRKKVLAPSEELSGMIILLLAAFGVALC